MDEEFARFYHSRCRFAQRYIDCLVTSTGKSNFVWDVFRRAGRLYGQPFVFSLTEVETHLYGKLSHYERHLIGVEKERRAAAAGLPLKTGSKPPSPGRFARLMDVMTLRACGLTFREISEEMGVPPNVPRLLLRSAGGCGYKGEIKYVLRVLRAVEKLDPANARPGMWKKG